MEALVSTIVSVHKDEKHLERCIYSLIDQTYSDLEIILADDNSSESCQKLCDKWQSMDSRIRVLRKTDGNYSDPRNAGLKAAKGEYVLFADSDDWLAIDMTENLVMHMKEHNADMIIFQHYEMLPNGSKSRRAPTVDKKLMSQKEALQYVLKSGTVNPVWNKMYKRSLVPDDYFPVGKSHEDAYVSAGLILKCDNVLYLDDAYYYCLQNSRNAVRGSINERLDGFDACCNDILAKYPEMNADVKAFRKKVKKAFSKSGKSPLAKITGKLSGSMKSAKKQYSMLVQLKKRRKKISADPKKKFFILCTPDHGNLGDRALLVGEDIFVGKYFPDYEIVHIEHNSISRRNPSHMTQLERMIKQGDILAIHAGGNIGTLYPGIHMKQEKIIEKLGGNKMLIFPQTFYYSNDETGRKMLEQTKAVYAQHKNLLVTLREKISYDYVKENFPGVKCEVLPDMVMNIPSFESESERNGAFICLRDDSEGTLGNEEKHILVSVLKERFDKIAVGDTNVGYALSEKDANEELRKLWQRMASSEIVITDRLHGMVFAALTQTPCIIVNSLSPKIRGCYEWIKDLEYVAFVDGTENLRESIEKVMAVQKREYRVTKLDETNRHFENLIRNL